MSLSSKSARKHSPVDYNALFDKLSITMVSPEGNLFPDFGRVFVHDRLRRKVSPIPFLTGFSLAMRPSGWATTAEIMEIMHPLKPATLRRNIYSLREYLERTSSYSVWAIEGAYTNTSESKYFREHQDWFLGKYMIGDATQPPTWIDVELPHMTRSNPVLQEFYEHAFTALKVKPKQVRRQNEQPVLQHIFTGDQRTILDYMARHGNQASVHDLLTYFYNDVNVYKDVDVIRIELHELRAKLAQESGSVRLVNDSHRQGIYHLET